MSRSTNVRWGKPCLEVLEGRSLPSVLLSGVVGQMAQPLSNMVSDMQSAATDLKTQVTPILNNTAPANTYAGAEIAEGKAIADWQRILVDQHAIQAVSSADVNALNAIAFAEFQAGDATDLLLLDFGHFFNFDATKALTDPVSKANNVVNDTTLQSLVNTNFHTINLHIDSTNTIAQETTVPTF